MSFNITVEGGTSVRLPTAGKYCDRDIVVTAEGGGIELDVITASTLPATATDGQIVVITDTTPGTVYIDTDEPGNPAAGDLWIRLEAGADVVLELSEESPYLGGGLTEANQWNGNAWRSCGGYMGIAGTWEEFATEIPPVGTALNDMTWEQISIISKKGLASTYFSIGDAKEITINGTVGNTTFSHLSVWAFILGFDHNSDIEGSNTIHFAIGKNGQSNATDVCLTDSGYESSYGSAGYFNMNYSQDNDGGWENSKMRTVLLGNNNTPASPLSGSLIAAIPSDLRDVMKGVTKYSDNTGGGSDKADYVTKTTDYLWLLAEYEVYGSRNIANSAEQNYQKQYDYYANGNSKTKYKHSSTSTTAAWWMRSVRASSSSIFCRVSTSGAAGGGYANNSYGIAPCFCV